MNKKKIKKPKEKELEFNLNRHIKVKFTEKGKDKFLHCGGAEVGEDGYYEVQAWCFIADFGEILQKPWENPTKYFELDIKIPVSEFYE